MIEIILFIFLIILMLEFLIKNFSIKIRQKFQWMILDWCDEIPVYKRELIKKFNNNTFNFNLGWDNKKNSNRTEEIKSAGELSDKKYKKINYSFNKLGARKDKINEKKKTFMQVLETHLCFVNM